MRSSHRYLINHRHQLDYRGALAHGLPIGSGEIEGAHRYIVQQRLKRSGAWWTIAHAEHMLAPRLNHANGQWEKYWQDDAKQAASQPGRAHQFWSRPFWSLAYLLPAGSHKLISLGDCSAGNFRSPPLPDQFASPQLLGNDLHLNTSLTHR